MNNIKRNYQRENKIMREELSPSVDLDKFQHLEVISVSLPHAKADFSEFIKYSGESMDVHS